MWEVTRKLSVQAVSKTGEEASTTTKYNICQNYRAKIGLACSKRLCDKVWKGLRDIRVRLLKVRAQLVNWMINENVKNIRLMLENAWSTALRPWSVQGRTIGCIRLEIRTAFAAVERPVYWWLGDMISRVLQLGLINPRTVHSTLGPSRNQRS